MVQRCKGVDAARRRVLLGGSAVVGLATSRLAIGLPSPSGTATSQQVRYDGTIATRGNQLINGAGAPMQLRGTNIQDYAFSIMRGNPDASGGGPGRGSNDAENGPDVAFLKKWKMNAIRIGINEACWLGYRCYSTAVNGDGVTGWVNPDKIAESNSYQHQVTQQIAALNSIGCYVILTLAGTNPGRSAPGGQDFMANQDNSVSCWQSLARTYGYPNGTALKKNGGAVDDRSVVFELFNEPEMYGGPENLWPLSLHGQFKNSWSLLMNGGFINQSYTTNGYSAFRDVPARPVYPYPCTTPSGTFIPGEKALVDGTAVGIVLCYYKNASFGLPASGTQFIHLYTPEGYNGRPPAVSSGTPIIGSISKATTQVVGDFGWYVAGHAQMLAGIRAAGAWNVCLLSGVQYAQDLAGWATFAPTDSTAPAGYSGSGWKPQIGACWHPYPASSYVSNATIESGGKGYAVGDTVLLPMPESGPTANSVYWQAQLQITDVHAGAITAVKINPYTGGRPGAAGGNASQFSSHSSGGSPIGGAYCNIMLPSNPATQYSTSGRGIGATFNLSFTSVAGGNWPNYIHWPAVAALKTNPGVPVVITEAGEHYGTGITGSPWMAALTSFCDANGFSLVTYAYTPNNQWTDLNGGDFSLADGDHVPTPGYGTFMYKWFTNHS